MTQASVTPNSNLFFERILIFMASERQQNFLGQQRVDVPHLRAIESGVANDFDSLVGVVMAGKLPTIATGFDIILTGAIGADAEQLKINVAAGSVIHYEATEAGSILRIPEDRPIEVLNSTNIRVRGSFTPNSINFVGIDLHRYADDTTSDIVQFIDPDTNSETPIEVPLARVLDYIIQISTADFSNTPNVCPIAKITTDASNLVTLIVDARNLFFRLGVGGSSPSAVSPYSWPGGRSEVSPLLASIAGDRSIFSLKDWLNAAMTRIWEIGGGEYWYSPNSDRNIFFGNQGPVFIGTGEHYEVTGGDHLHWRGCIFNFDNSTGIKNEIADQLTDSAGLTNLSEGECLYVDLDRTQNRAGVNALPPQKATLATVGASSRPGQRWVFVVKTSTGYVIRGRNVPVGSSSVPTATTGIHGVTRLSAQPTALAGVAYVPAIVSLINSGSITSGLLAASGISHSVDIVSPTNLLAGNIVIGRGTAAGDHNVLISSIDALYETIISGTGTFANGRSALKIENPTVNHNTSTTSRILNVRSFGGTDIETALIVEGIGAIGMRNIDGNVLPATPAPSATEDIRAKRFMRHNGIASPNRRDQYCILWHDGTVTVMTEGPLY